MLRKLSIIICLSFSISLYAQTNLSGNIAGMVLTSEGNPYIISDNLIIPENKRVIIKEGCVFLFKPFTGIVVGGSIIGEGTLDNPVIFTTINDNNYFKFNDSTHYEETPQLPNPFDWNGILIKKSASIVNLSNFSLKYSVYGIKSKTENIIVSNGTFQSNGQFNITITGMIEKVADGLPFSYPEESILKLAKSNKDKIAVEPKIIPSKETKINSDKKKSKKLSKNRKEIIIKKIVPISIGGLGLVSGVLSGWLGKNTKDTYGLYKNEKSRILQNEYKDQGKKEMSGTVIFGSVSVITIPLSIYLYIRNHKALMKKNMSFIPVIQKESIGLRLALTI